MRTINVLAMQRTSAADRARIEAVDPAIKVTDAGGWFDGEIRETWPAFATARYLGPNANGHGTREERDRLLAEAEVILGGFPFILDMRARAPKLKWFHQRPAGASNLVKGDLWGSDVVVTTSRGRRQHAADRGIRRGRHAALRQGPAPRRRRSRRRRVRLSRLSAAAGAGQDRLRRRRRRHRSRGRPAVRRARHARGRHPPAAGAGRAPARRVQRARRPRRPRPVPGRRAISWPSAASGRPRPPTCSTRSASPP